MKYFFFFLMFCFISSAAQENVKYINVTGTSELHLPADVINFTVRIRIVEDSIEKSKRLNDEYLQELLAILKNTGIKTNDIEVSPITLGKSYETDMNRGIRKQNGYYTEVRVTFALNDLSVYYGLTNRLSSTDHFEIDNSTYNVSDYEKQHQLAYENALKAARDKAEYMTKTLGVKLGEVLEIDENNNWQSYPNPFNTATEVDYQGGGVSGKVTIRRSVRVKFAME